MNAVKRQPGVAWRGNRATPSKPLRYAICPAHTAETSKEMVGVVPTGLVFWCRAYGHYFTATPPPEDLSR